MGNSQSYQAPPPAPPPAPPVPVITLPVQRVPTQDGASGLHYSGRTYTNQFNALSSDICQGASASVDQIGDVFPNGISSTTLPVDPVTKRVKADAVASYVASLESQKLIPGRLPSFDAQMTADKAFYAAVQAEYCFYETRYVAALTQMLSLIAEPNGSDPATLQTATDATVALNSRLNSLLELINYVGNERARAVNSRGPQIDAANSALDEKVQELAAQKEMLMSSDGRIRTQEEMMRFSAEKSHAMNIQIMFFVALNVVALGTVLTVYKQSA